MNKHFLLALSFVFLYFGITNIISNPTDDLFEALTYVDFHEVQKAINRGANTASTEGSGRETPIFLATAYNNINMAQLLLKNGAGKAINIKNNHGQTPLENALFYKNIGMIKLLIAYGAIIPDNLKNNPMIQQARNEVREEANKARLQMLQTGKTKSADTVFSLETTPKSSFLYNPFVNTMRYLGTTDPYKLFTEVKAEEKRHEEAEKRHRKNNEMGHTSTATAVIKPLEETTN